MWCGKFHRWSLLYARAVWTVDYFRPGERPRRLDRDRERDLERPARRELRRPSHGSPGPEILICGIGAGGVPVVLSRAFRHFKTGMRLSP